MKLAARAERMHPSATLAVVARAKELKREGHSVVSFGAGEPDFDSPPAALRSAREAMESGQTHYTPAAGIPELREAVCGYYRERFGLDYAPEQVVAGAGAKPLIYEALGCMADPGDEVIVIAPAWVSYVEQIRLFGAEPVVVEPKEGELLPTAEAIEAAVTDRTAAILLNSPTNPSGAVFSEPFCRELGDLAVRRDLWIIWDEIYERLVYGDARHVNIVKAMPELAERTLLVNGVSKAFAMTGWRIGYGLGPDRLMAKMRSFQGHLTSNPCSIAQWAALGALQGAEEDVERMHGVFTERRELMLKRLATMPRISFHEPDGAFYVFPRITDCFGAAYQGETITDEASFCRLLLEREHLATVPGNAFLAPGYFRLSYANSFEEIEEGMTRLKRFLEALEG